MRNRRNHLPKRNGGRPLGVDMTRMLQSMKHRGPDSTGYALYGPASDLVLVRFTLADANDPRDFEFADRLVRHRAEVEGGCASSAPRS